jgi:hypothetical protein
VTGTRYDSNSVVLQVTLPDVLYAELYAAYAADPAIIPAPAGLTTFYGGSHLAAPPLIPIRRVLYCKNTRHALHHVWLMAVLG